MTTVRVKLPFASLAEMRAKHAGELAAGEFVLRTNSPRDKGAKLRLELRLKDDTLCFAALAVVEAVEAAGNGASRMRLRFLEGDAALIDLIDELGGRPPPLLKPDGGAAQAKPPAAPAGKPAAKPAAAKPKPAAPADSGSFMEPPEESPPAPAKPASKPPAAPARPGAPAQKAAPAAKKPEQKAAGAKPAPPIADPFESFTLDPDDDPGAEAIRTGAIAGPAPKASDENDAVADEGADVLADEPAANDEPASTHRDAVAKGPAPEEPAAPAPPPPAAKRPPPAPAAKPAPAKPPATKPPAPAKPPPPSPPRPSDGPPPPPPPSTRPAPPPMAPPVIDPAAAAQKAKVVAQPLEARSVPADVKPVVRTPAGKGAIIGIDLGTTNSCAAVVKHHKPFIIPSREGYNTIPSVVALTDKGKLIVGHPAKGQLLINPRSTVYGSKRLVGRQFNSPVVADLLGRFAYEIVAGERGEAAVRLGDDVLSLQQISALIIGEVKDIAQQWLGTSVTRAVITVPAYYNDNQRQAVRAAGALAGLHVERILNEPTAAAIAFAHGRELEKRILVYDLGGGTFDASVLELHGSVYEVVSTGGDTFLGGVDFDKAIVQHLLDEFKKQHRIEFPGDRVALQRITDAAERAKIGLSEGAMAKINVPFVALVGDKPYDLNATLRREELDKLTTNLVDRTLRVCDDVLTARGLSPGDVAEVILVGGMSRMPLVRQRVKEYFGKEPSKSVHPDEAVALGAALLADSIDSGDIGGMTLIDVLPMSIGVGLPGGRFKKIIDRNTSLPHKRSYSIWTSRDDQEVLEIPVFQGENDRAEKNEYLGTLMVPDLPRGARGTVVFDVQFSLSAESILTVTAEQRGTARMVSATFSTQETPDGIRRRLEDHPRGGLDSPDVERKPAASGGLLKKLFGKSKTG